MMTLAQELYKAHSPGNRFVYYPATKSWNNGPCPAVKDLSLEKNGHLYVHIPYCHSLCTFCGCNIKIDGNREEHLKYVDALKKELSLKDPEGEALEKIKVLTIGGGSPNALSFHALEELVYHLKRSLPGLEEVLVEIDPRPFSKEQVSLFEELRSKETSLRFSMGVQDFSAEVCANVNRHQSFDDIVKVFELIKDNYQLGLDLIWGLPLQSPHDIHTWSNSLAKINPAWVNYYPLAKVPWLAPYQEAYGSFHCPEGLDKYVLFEAGHSVLENYGLEHFGFGHYLAPQSELYQAWQQGSLTRNVSGLFKSKISFDLGLGVGSISQFKDHYHQNERVLDKYKYAVLVKGDASGLRAHKKSTKEQAFLETISSIMYSGTIPTQWHGALKDLPPSWFAMPLKGETDGHLSPKGRLFLKNILQALEIQYFSPAS